MPELDSTFHLDVMIDRAVEENRRRSGGGLVNEEHALAALLKDVVERYRERRPVTTWGDVAGAAVALETSALKGDEEEEA